MDLICSLQIGELGFVRTDSVIVITHNSYEKVKIKIEALSGSYGEKDILI